MFSRQIHDLAEKVPQGGFRWVEDGPTIRKIVQLVDDYVTPKLGARTDVQGIVALRREVVFHALDLLDQVYGWDAPRMTDEQERAFYRFIVVAEVK